MVSTSVEHRDGPVKLHSKTTFPLHNWWREGLHILKDYISHIDRYRSVEDMDGPIGRKRERGAGLQQFQFVPIGHLSPHTKYGLDSTYGT